MEDNTEIITKDYGYIAYLLLKFESTRINKGVLLTGIHNPFTILKQYNNSEFSLYNEILKKVVKDR